MSGRALIAALALSSVLAGPRSGRAQLAVDELEVFLRPEAGAPHTGVVHVTNDTNQPVQAMLDVQDWNRDETGANRFAPLGTMSGSCRGRLKVFPTSLRIEAHQTEAVRIMYDGDASATCWSVVFIQADQPSRAREARSQITYVVRTGVKVYVEPANARREGDIASVKQARVRLTDRDTTTVRGLEVWFRNTGAAHLKAAGAVEVRTADNQVVAKHEIPQFPIAPGDERRIPVPLTNLASGRYIALALIDYAGAEIAAGQLEFEIP